MWCKVKAEVLHQIWIIRWDYSFFPPPFSHLCFLIQQQTVENPINPNVVFNRAPSDPLAVPGPPTEPMLVNQTQHSVTVSWHSSSRMGASPLIGYTVEAYIPGVESINGGASWTWGGQRTNRTWLVLARQLKSTVFVVSDLKPAASIIFLVMPFSFSSSHVKLIFFYYIVLSTLFINVIPSA